MKNLIAAVLLLGCGANHASFIETTASGYLIIEYLGSHAAPAYTEFGLGTPSTDSVLSERNVALIRDGITLSTPSIVNMGFYEGGSELDFYMKDIYGGTFWAFYRKPWESSYSLGHRGI